MSIEISKDEDFPKTSLSESSVNEPAAQHSERSSSIDKWVNDEVVNDLPEEILNNIFTLLAPRDRRSAKLVCKNWFNATNSKKFIFNEKKVFYHYYNMPDILASLSKNAENFLNLEFRFFKSEDNISSLSSVMHKIYFLSFIECEFNDNFIYELISNCPNLQKFRWEGDRSCFDRNVLDRLTQSRFTNPNLQILKIFSRIVDMSDENVHSLFTTIFPNIRKLSFRISIQLECRSRPIADSSAFSFSTVLDKVIERKNVLEQLKLNLYKPEWLYIAPYSFTKLKDINVFIPGDVAEEVILDFFTRQPCLERISCISCTGKRFPSTALLEHLINHCTELKHLKLIFRASFIIFSPKMFLQLAKSKLLTLYLEDIRIDMDKQCNFTEYLCKNENLRVLRILGTCVCWRIQLFFIRCCKNLTHLELTCASEAVLPKIARSLPNLKILKLGVPENCARNVDGFDEYWNIKRIEACVRSLSGLEHLTLSFHKFIRTFDISCIPRSVKYFYFDAHNSPPPILSFDSFKYLYNLEDVGIRLMGPIGVNFWIEIFSSLSKLRRLEFDDVLNWKSPIRFGRGPFNFQEDPYKNLFDDCPSFRLLIHKIRNKKEVRYFYDSYQKKIKIVHNSDFTPIVLRIDYTTTHLENRSTPIYYC